jgi:MFS family permease
MVAIALANTLFFQVDPTDAQGKVLLYLLFTMAPFAVVGPFIGPAMDRVPGGHRLVILASGLGRMVLALAMIPNADGGLLLFPEAFMVLVLGKTYQVGKAAIVPSTVSSDRELVEANSKLQLLSGLAGAAAAIPAGLASLIGPGAVLFLAGAVFLAASLAAIRVPDPRRPVERVDPEVSAELNTLPVQTSAAAMSWLRGVVGFVSFLLAFALRRPPDAPPLATTAGRVVGARGDYVGVAPQAPYPQWYFAVVVVAAVVGGLAGSVLAPKLRGKLREGPILAGALVAVVVVAFGGLVLPGLLGMMLLSAGVAASASVGKQAFDALVQADAPDVDRGRVFARFESQFQLVWVVGAALAVFLRLGVTAGSAVLFVGGVLATLGYGVLARNQSAYRSG